MITTVDGRNPANQLRLVVYPIIYRVLIFHRYIPGGAGFLPSTVRIVFVFALYLLPSLKLHTSPSQKEGIVSEKARNVKKTAMLVFGNVKKTAGN